MLFFCFAYFCALHVCWLHVFGFALVVLRLWVLRLWVLRYGFYVGRLSMRHWPRVAAFLACARTRLNILYIDYARHTTTHIAPARHNLALSVSPCIRFNSVYMLHPAVPPLAFSSDSLLHSALFPSRLAAFLRSDSPLLGFVSILFHHCYSSTLSYLLSPPPYPLRSVLLSIANFLCINTFNSSCNLIQSIRSFRPTPLKCKLPAKVVLFSHIRNSAE